MAYLKRLAMPKTWPFPRKGTIYLAKPLPGRKLEMSLSLVTIIKHLGFAKTAKEANFILNKGRVKVNGKVVKEKSYSVGLFDTIAFPIRKEYFRLLLKNKKLFIHPISEQESNIKPAKVVKKTSLKGKKQQINLDDGRNILSKEEYNTGDTLIFNFAAKKIDSHIKLEGNCFVYILGGKYLGHTAKLSKLEEKSKFAICQIKDKKVNVLRKHIFVLGKDKPAITLPANK